MEIEVIGSEVGSMATNRIGRLSNRLIKSYGMAPTYRTIKDRTNNVVAIDEEVVEVASTKHVDHVIICQWKKGIPSSQTLEIRRQCLGKTLWNQNLLVSDLPEWIVSPWLLKKSLIRVIHANVVLATSIRLITLHFAKKRKWIFIVPAKIKFKKRQTPSVLDRRLQILSATYWCSVSSTDNSTIFFKNCNLTSQLLVENKFGTPSVYGIHLMIFLL